MAGKYLTDKQLEEILARSDSEYEERNDVDDESDEAIETPEVDERMDDIVEFLSDRTAVHIEDSDDSSQNDQQEVEFPGGRTFVWETKTFSPKIHEFDDTNCGCKVEGDLDNSAIKYFEFFFTREIMELIVSETNKYYEYVCRMEHSESSRIKKWYPVTYQELYCYLAVALLMPHVKKNKLNYYWSTDEFLSTPIFSRLMKRDRFLLITKLLHFCDNDIPVPENRDSLQKIRIIVDNLKNKFKEGFCPFKNICIDESLMLFRGRVFFRQYIPSKRHRFGVKFFLLCDCETGYILDFIIYTGASTNVKEFEGADIGKSGNIVMTLLEPYLNKGHTLYVDNWYTSPNLFDCLYKNKTTACGTVKKNRKNMPTFTEKLEKGEFTHRSTKNLLAVRWKDKREVNMLTSCQRPDVKETGKEDYATGRNILKPSCIVDYNENMGAVDKSDMLLSSIECIRKSMKWYKKVFFHLLDCAVLNAYQLHKCNTANYLPLEQFHLQLIKEIITKYHTPISTRTVGRRVLDHNSELRLTERHFPKFVAPTGRKKTPTKRCTVCAKNQRRRESRYICQTCNVALCIIPCFELYHTKKHY